MDHQNHNTESRKNKHLIYKERIIIELRLKDGFSAYKIAKELNGPINTVLNEIRRSTTTQIKQGNYIEMYLADTGETIYKNNRQNSCRMFRRLECNDFITYAVNKMKNHSWSPNACVGNALAKGKFQRSQIVYTKTLYNYIDLGLLAIINADLPMKLRRNTKPSKVKNNKKKLGKSIAERPSSTNNREEFGHWEIDTVVGQKSKDDCVLLTILERKTRNAIIHKIASKTAEAVTEALNSIRNVYGDKFDKILKTSSEISDLSALESGTDTKVYFTHPYSSFKKGTNERHNDLIRRFIPKGKRIANYSPDDIACIEKWINTLPRRILNYKTPEELFEIHLDEIYAS